MTPDLKEYKRVIRDGLGIEWLLWTAKGCPVPPTDPYKLAAVRKYFNRFGFTTFIETGTYMGQMIDGVKNLFDIVISIELSKKLYLKAKKRFAKDDNVFIYHGDSAKLLPAILEGINEPAVFWLDAHYSGGISTRGDQVTPIVAELQTIFNHSVHNHVILIDDASGFTMGYNGYPTIDYLKKILPENMVLHIENDIISIRPRRYV